MTDIHKTIRSLRSLERGITPDPAWVRSARARLLMQVRNTMPSVAAVEKNRKTLAAAYPSFMRILRGPAFVICSIIAVVVGGSIASVRAAERSLPGDALYTIKLVAEQTQLALTPSASDRVKLKAEFTKRRVEDLNTIVRSPVSGKDARVRQATDILKQDLQTLQEQLDQVKKGSSPSRAVAEAAKVVDREAVDVVKSLGETREGLSNDVGSDAQKTVTDAQSQAADLAMNALGMLVDARKDASAKDVMSDADLSASVAEHKDVAAATAANALELAVANADSASAPSLPASSTTIGSSVSTASTATATGTAALAKDAQNSLGEVEALLGAAKVDEAITKLRDASAKSFQAQSQIESILSASGMSASSSTAFSNAATTSSGAGATSSRE
jgi:hypothetical protein